MCAAGNVGGELSRAGVPLGGTARNAVLTRCVDTTALPALGWERAMLNAPTATQTRATKTGARTGVRRRKLTWLLTSLADGGRFVLI